MNRLGCEWSGKIRKYEWLSNNNVRDGNILYQVVTANHKMEILIDYDYINGKKHSKANETNACPQCDNFKSESNASRRDHYVRSESTAISNEKKTSAVFRIQHHYDIYYSMVRESLFIEGWLNRNLGHAKLAGRRCLHCQPSTSHNGRIRLLKHIQSAHPDKFSTLRAEFTALPHIGKVKDKNLHKLLAAQSFHRNSPSKYSVAGHNKKSLHFDSTTASANLPLALPISSLPTLPITEPQPPTPAWPILVTTEPTTQIMPTRYYPLPLGLVPTCVITPELTQALWVVLNQPNIVPYFTQYGLQIVNN